MNKPKPITVSRESFGDTPLRAFYPVRETAAYIAWLEKELAQEKAKNAGGSK
jgi:hypothetical protein